MEFVETMVQNLSQKRVVYKKSQQALAETRTPYHIRMAPIEAKVALLTAEIESILDEMNTDPVVIEGLADFNTALRELNATHTDAEEMCKALWIQGRLPRKTFEHGGHQFRIKETTKRTVGDQELMVQAAAADGVYDKVIKGAKYTVNRKDWNAWVDLHNPPGVTVERIVSAKVIFEEGIDG